MLNRIEEEPVLFQGIIQAGLAVLLAFGIGLSGEQMGAIMALTAAILSFITRRQVTPNSKL